MLHLDGRLKVDFFDPRAAAKFDSCAQAAFDSGLCPADAAEYLKVLDFS